MIHRDTQCAMLLWILQTLFEYSKMDAFALLEVEGRSPCVESELCSAFTCFQYGLPIPSLWIFKTATFWMQKPKPVSNRVASKTGHVFLMHRSGDDGGGRPCSHWDHTDSNFDCVIFTEMRKAQGCFVRDAVLPKQLWCASSLAWLMRVKGSVPERGVVFQSPLDYVQTILIGQLWSEI